MQRQIQQRRVGGRGERFSGESFYSPEAVPDRVAVQVQLLSHRGGGAAEGVPGQGGVDEQSDVPGIESVEGGEQVGENIHRQLRGLMAFTATTILFVR